MKRFTIAAAVIALFGAAALFARSETATRTVYFSALDKKGAPIADLKATEVVVKEADRSQVPLTVERATTPMRIAVVIDDHGLGVPEVRASLTTFTEALRGRAEIGVFSTTLPEATVVDFTRDDRALAAGIEKLVRTHAALNTDVTRPGLGLGALTDNVARQFEQQGTARPVMIVVTIDQNCRNAPWVNSHFLTTDQQFDSVLRGTPEPCPGYSTKGTSPLIVEQVLRSRATFFAIAARHSALDDHDPVIDASAEASGGHVEAVLMDSAIPTALTRITDDLLNQYAVTYNSSPTPKDGARLRLTINRSDVIIRAPERVAVR